MREISLAAAKSSLEDPSWYREKFVLYEGYASFDPDEAMALLGAYALVAEEDERWTRYLASLHFAHLFARHPLPAVRNRLYTGNKIVMALPAELYRLGSLPTREELSDAVQQLALLRHGSEADRQRRVHANFVLSALPYDPLSLEAGDDSASYDPELDGGVFYKIGRVLNRLNFGAFGRADDLERLEAISGAPVPDPLPDRYDLGGNRWGWMRGMAGQMPVEQPLSWPELIDYGIGDFAALLGTANEIYRFKRENGEYPADLDQLWEQAEASIVPFNERPYYSRLDHGFELTIRNAYFDFAEEAEEDEYDTSVYNTYWRGPDAVFPVWKY